MARHTGRHFLQIAGPTNIPDQVLHAISAPAIDHRGPDFAELTQEILSNIGAVFGTTGPVMIFPSSGTGAWEAALVNTLSPGDHVLCFETGYFATLWRQMATKLGLHVELVPGDWRHGVDADIVANRLKTDTHHHIKAVCVVHNETSTGVTSQLSRIRTAIDSADHPALFLVDAISAIGCMDFRHDEWRVDVTIAASQKGLMLPAGLGFNAVSAKALAASKSAGLPRSYWDWRPIQEFNANNTFPYTPATNLFYGLRESLRFMQNEGLAEVFSRHARLAAATRAAVRAWGFDVLCLEPDEYSQSVTAIVLPEEHNADELRKHVLERFDVSLGGGLGKLRGKVFRIGHLGYLNELMLLGALTGVEMGLREVGIPVESSGVVASMNVLSESV